MTHVVTGNCTDCRYTECVTTCPVECFHAGDSRVYIDPEVCIDCGACVEACPVGAIYDAAEMPAELEHWVVINAENAAALPVITSKQPELPTAEEKRRQLVF